MAVALAGAVPLLAATPAGAPPLSFTLTIKKVVSGVVPAGTTFTVTVSCVTQDSTGTGAGSSDATTPTTGGAHTASDSFPSTITFNANGDPTTTNTGSLIVGESCTVAENPPGTGGAQSVSYGCATTNASDVACVSNQQVRVIPDNSAGGAATITVTNAFPTPTTAPPVVVAAPKFTG